MPHLDRRWILTTALLAAVLAVELLPGCGRTLSRFGLGAQTIRAPSDAQQVLGISFHETAQSVVKDVVFVMADCTVLAKEYKDISPFEGELRVVSHDGTPFRQAGCVPRGAVGR